MRFLNIILSVNPREGGPIEGVRQQAMGLATLGHSSDVASMDLPDDPWVTNQPFPVHALGDAAGARRRKSKLPWRRYGHAPRMIPWIAQHARDYDAVIVHGLWNYTAYAAWRGLRGTGVPYFVRPHGMMATWFRRRYPFKHWIKQAYWLFSEGRLLRDANCVLFTAAVEEEEARTAFLGYRYRGRVISPGITDNSQDGPSDAFRQAVPGLGQRRYLLFLSRIHEKKGVDILIPAFAAVAAAYPEIDLVVAGPDDGGLTPTLRRQAESLGIADRIHWPGMLSHESKWSGLLDALALVLSSHQENFGLVVTEAMASGLPVLTTDKVALWTDVQAANCGLVSTDTTENFAQIMRTFLALPDAEHIAMGQRGRAAFLAKFEVGGAARALADLAEEFAK